jgi:hypothetical protein
MDKTTPYKGVWQSFRLTIYVDRYGLYNGEILIKESVPFAEGMVLGLSVPVWRMVGTAFRLFIPVVRFERNAKNLTGREWVECQSPTFVQAVDLGETMRTAAIKRVGKPDATYPNSKA